MLSIYRFDMMGQRRSYKNMICFVTISVITGHDLLTKKSCNACSCVPLSRYPIFLMYACGDKFIGRYSYMLWKYPLVHS